MLIEKLFPHFFKSRFRNEIILIVDSKPKDLNYIVRTVIAGGYNVLKASTCKDGLVLALRHKPELIIFDLELSDAPGIQLCRSLKSDSLLKDIPLVVLTGINSPQAILEAYELGIENYLVKPIGKNFLSKEIERILCQNQESTKSAL